MTVTNGTNTIVIDGAGTSPAVSIKKANICRVEGVYGLTTPTRNAAAGFETQFQKGSVIIFMNDRNQIIIPLTKVTNQAGWVAGGNSQVDQAVIDIDGWL